MRYPLCRVLLCAALTLASFQVILANPTGPQIIEGQASFDDSITGVLEVTNSNGAIIDWQGVGCGRPALDVGYFLATNLRADVAAESEEDLVRAYHEVLLAEGIPDYPFEQCWRDYQLAKLLFVQTIVLSIEALEISEERTADFGATYVRRLAALLPKDNLDDLLS